MPSLPPGGGVDFPRVALSRVTEMLGEPVETLRGQQAERKTVMLRYPVVGGTAVLIATEDPEGTLLHGEAMLLASRTPGRAATEPHAAPAATATAPSTTTS